MRTVLKTLERILVVVGLGLTFFAVLEAIQAYQALAQLHPWAGYAFLALLAGLLAYLIWQVRALFAYRRVLQPPELLEGTAITAKRRKAALRYISRVTARLTANEILLEKAPAELEMLEAEVASLGRRAGSPGVDLREGLDTIEREHIAPLLTVLDNEAEAVVSDNVGIVSLGTALSPYRSFDLYIVLARNLRMVNRIVRIYRTRPSWRETLAIFYDIARVVSAVNLLNAMDTVWSGLGRHIPLVGRYGEAMSEGLFSGLLTSVAGHAAIDRSRSYRPWSRDAAVREYRSRLHRWARDVMGILRRHGIDRLTGRRPAAPPESDPDTEPSSKRGLGRIFRRK